MRLLLTLLSRLFRLAVAVRNFLYDYGIRKSTEPPQFTVSVGNITVGGTGKTPHAEYLIRSLKNDCPVAYLSRGYRRETHGMVLASQAPTCAEIGDEATQVKWKFRDIPVVVDGNRRRALQWLHNNTDAQIVILDDAFQHRRITPHHNILLIDVTRSPFDDTMLPAGRLREPVSSIERADTVIITKCPPDFRPVDMMTWRSRLHLTAAQSLYFTRIRYASPLRESTQQYIPEDMLSGTRVLLVTGVERPEPLLRHLLDLGAHVEQIRYPDHHYFTQTDMAEIVRRFSHLGGDMPMIITTEKDIARLTSCGQIPDIVRDNLYSIPIEIEFLDDDGKLVKEIAEKFCRYKKYK